MYKLVSCHIYLQTPGCRHLLNMAVSQRLLAALLALCHWTPKSYTVCRKYCNSLQQHLKTALECDIVSAVVWTLCVSFYCKRYCSADQTSFLSNIQHLWVTFDHVIEAPPFNLWNLRFLDLTYFLYCFLLTCSEFFLYSLPIDLKGHLYNNTLLSFFRLRSVMKVIKYMYFILLLKYSVEILCY